MAVTEIQRTRMRFALQLDAITLPDATIDLVFGQAEEEYGAAAAITAYAHLLVIEALLFGGAKEVDYQQNATSEKASQRFDHLKALYPIWQGKLSSAVDAAYGGAVRWGMLNKKPTRREEYPDD